MNLTDTIRITAATARITSLIVADDVPGRWWIKDPIDQAMTDYRTAHAHVRVPPATIMNPYPARDERFVEPWWWRYREGLDCVYCVSVWAGILVAAGETVSRAAPRPVRIAWQIMTGALALSYVAGHAEARLSGGDDA